MNRQTVRWTVLSVVAVLGLIAIAQARYGGGTTPDPEAAAPAAEPDPLPTLAAAEVLPTKLEPAAAAEPVAPAAADSPADIAPAEISADGLDGISNPLRGTLASTRPADSAILVAAVAAPAQDDRPDEVQAAQYEAGPTEQPEAPDEQARQAVPTLAAAPRAEPAPAISEDDARAGSRNRQAAGDRYAAAAAEDPATQDPSRTPPAEQEPAPAAAATAADARELPATVPPASFETPAESPAKALTRPAADDLEAVEGTGVPGERQFEGAQSPSLTLEKLAPEEIQVGKECVFELRIQNTGRTTARGVTVLDEVPRGTRFVSATPPPRSIGDGPLAWELGTLEPGEQTAIEMHLMPIAEGEIGSVASVQFEAQASVRTRSTKPELSLSTRLAGPRRVMVGQQAVIKIEVSNPGTGAATGVILLEDIPDAVNHPAGKQLEFEIGTLAPNESREMELVLTAKSAGKVTNLLRAKGDASLDIAAEVDFEIIAPDLQIAIDGPRRRYLERPAVYTLSIANPGTAMAKDIELAAYLPKGMKFVEANNHGRYDPGTHSVVWGLEELPASESGKVKLVALPTESGEQTLRAMGKASQGLTDEAEQTMHVEGLAAIMFEVIDLEDPIEVGGETTYEIRVLNQGSKAATNVQIVAIFPPDLKPISASGHTKYTMQADRVVFAPLARLAPKADTTFRLKARGLAEGHQRIEVQLTTDDVQEPVTKEESTTVYADE